MLGAAVSQTFFGSPFWGTWKSWWIADGVGMLLVTPTVVMWANKWREIPSIFTNKSWVAEFICLVGLLAALTFYVFGPTASTSTVAPLYLIFPPLIWIALRFPPFWTATTVLVLTGFIVFLTTMEYGPFYNATQLVGAHVLASQIFFSVIGFSSLVFSVVVAERTQAEEALTISEARYREIVEGTDNLITEIDAKGLFTFVNETARKFYGLSPKECIGLSAFETVHPDDRESTRNQFDEWMKNQGPASVTFDNRIVSIAGEVRYMLWTSTLHFDDAGNVFSVKSIARDVTDSKQAEIEKEKLEDQLRQSHKMEAVGRLAGGVAHDFNNILTGINGYAEMLLQGMEPNNPMYSDIKEIRDAGLRAANLTAQLLAFSRKQIIAPKVIQPNDILQNSQNMLRRLIGEDIDLTFLPAKGLWQIKADPGQLDQILVNLAINARDAMPDGGKLTIETQNVKLDEEFCKAHANSLPGDYVMVIISDSGHGMEEETLNHVFEPFFSTKEKDKGTGLGLSTVYGIMKQNKGLAHVYSEQGMGTTFRLYFPAVTKKSEQVPQKEMKAYLTGSETVVLVEDEQMVRILAKKVLEKQGYKVIEHAAAEPALINLEEHDDTIDLLLTDVIMPGINGKKLFEKLKEKRPNLKVLFMSGYTEDVIGHHGILEAGTEFLQKPFTIELLTRKVREVLDK
jgi:PAS domain S-box-containing protein